MEIDRLPQAPGAPAMPEPTPAPVPPSLARRIGAGLFGVALAAAVGTAALAALLVWGAQNSPDTVGLALAAGGAAAVGGWLLARRWVRRLVQPLARMAADLDALARGVPYAELQPLARTVLSDREMRDQTEAMRREFTANVSHELKTPLTSISGYAELLETGMARGEDVPAFGGRIHREAQRMIALVSDILRLSELDSLPGTQARPELVPLDLREPLHECAAAMQLNAHRAYVTLTCDLPARPATAAVNRDLLGELLQNLCDNAIRYNRPGGHVVLSCGAGAQGAWLSVEDNGIGIPPEAQGRVFERFYRVDKSRSKATGGTGLGLAIVKHIALLHGAHIALTSTPGHGTTVRVTFPPAE